MIQTAYEQMHGRMRVKVGNSYLTPREYQVVAMYMDGVRQADMPNLLACSAKTIQGHVRVAKDRVGAKTIHELIAMVAKADVSRERGRSSNREPFTDPVSGAAPSRAL